MFLRAHANKFTDRYFQTHYQIHVWKYGLSSTKGELGTLPEHLESILWLARGVVGMPAMISKGNTDVRCKSIHPSGGNKINYWICEPAFPAVLTDGKHSSAPIPGQQKRAAFQVGLFLGHSLSGVLGK